MDCTLGGGGHTRLIWQHIQPDGQIIGIDQDGDILAKTQEQLTDDGVIITPVQQRFDALRDILDKQHIDKITGGLLADIGVSSFQLDQGDRGFSFNKDAPLDMRMDRSQEKTAENIINHYSEANLIRIFSDYGEERLSKTIAKNIVIERRKKPITSTIALANLVSNTYQQTLGYKGKKRIHPATCVFQALRIEVNDELGALERLIAQLPDCLDTGAIAVFISFHSLEDRIIKRGLRDLSKDNDDSVATFDLLTKKPVSASKAEIKQNPRSRSAKVRAAIRK